MKINSCQRSEKNLLINKNKSIPPKIPNMFTNPFFKELSRPFNIGANVCTKDW